MSTNQLATTHRFARDLGFTPNKVSTFISIMIDALDRDRSDGLRTMEGSFLDFKKALLAHSVERPPASAGIFDEADVTKIVDYVTNRCDATRMCLAAPVLPLTAPTTQLLPPLPFVQVCSRQEAKAGPDAAGALAGRGAASEVETTVRSAARRVMRPSQEIGILFVLISKRAQTPVVAAYRTHTRACCMRAAQTPIRRESAHTASMTTAMPWPPPMHAPPMA